MLNLAAPESLESSTVSAVLALIEERNPDESSLEALTVVEADLLATVTAVGVIGNGGHRYWYEGKDHTSTERAARGFDHLGLPEAAEAMRRSLDVFPKRVRPARWPYVSASAIEAAVAVWAPLDKIVRSCEWDRAALVYTLAHADELIEVLPDARASFRKLERAWGAAAELLRAAMANVAEGLPAECRVWIAANDHHRAHAALRAAGPRRGRAASFWASLRKVAELLGVHDAGASAWNHRFAVGGFVVVEVEVVQNDAGVRRLQSGPAKWNRGSARKLIGSERAELYATSTRSKIVFDSIHDRGRVRLVPAADVSAGTAIVIHRKGRIIARGEVIEVVAPE